MRRLAIAAACVAAALSLRDFRLTAFAEAAAVKTADATQHTTAQHAHEVRRLVVRNAMVIPGTGIPAFGPVDILLEGGTIARMGNATAEKWPDGDAVIDATGKYVMPGIV